MSLFFNLGRGLGYATIPVIRKSKLAWRSLAKSGTDSAQAESEFGSSLAAELRLKAGVANDPKDLGLVRGILQKLSEHLRDKTRSFRADILLEPLPSAMALPGGFVFLSNGLLDLCQRDPDELAFVIGHEMGHVIRGHALQRMLTRIGAEGLSAIVSRGLLNPALRQTGIKWLESSHSPEAEFEADEFGLRIALLAGYDGHAALGLLERVAAQRETPHGPGEYFQSHPGEAERIAQIKTLLKISPRPKV